jgi:hypothetical protein
MDNNPFKVFGSSAGLCLGRENDKAHLASLLGKNHISIVGPRYIGKTVLARELCTILPKRSSEITGSIYWDLGQRTPSEDTEFYLQFAAVLGKGLQGVNSESAEKLARAKDNFHEEIHDVFDYLQELGLCVLICLDSFDYLLGRGVITRNLWDNLGALADEFKSLRYLAVSRKTLNDLCWVPGSENSHFWKLFGTSPRLLKCMTESDLEGFTETFARSEANIGSGFTRELWNWSGGIPPMVSALSRDMWEGADGSTVFDNELVNRVANALLKSTDTMVPEIWRSLTGEQQRFIVELGEKGKQMELPTAARPLVDSQIITLQGKCWYVHSRLLRQYAASEHGRAGGYLRDFFESEDAYSRNIRSVLEFRLARVKNIDIDKVLRTHVTDMVEKLDEPDIVISKPRLIANRAFELIWEREFGGYEIPGEWTREFSKLTDKVPGQRIRSELGAQFRVLELMTEENCSLHTRVSRYTYHLLNGLGPVSNTGSHLRGDRHSFGYGVAITMWCLQLVEQLSQELAS